MTSLLLIVSLVNSNGGCSLGERGRERGICSGVLASLKCSNLERQMGTTTLKVNLKYPFAGYLGLEGRRGV